RPGHALRSTPPTRRRSCMSQRTWSAAALLLAFLPAGCKTVVYRSETVLQPDGKVRRAIYQPADETPDEVRDPEKWRPTTHAPDPQTLDNNGWPASLTELPPHPEDNKHRYFVAWQDFASPKAIPDHVAFRSNNEHTPLPPGKLVRDYGRTDYVFVVEHR